jgi:hypothetical protein
VPLGPHGSTSQLLRAKKVLGYYNRASARTSGWMPVSRCLCLLCVTCPTRFDSQLRFARNAPNYNTRRPWERKPPLRAPHCGYMRVLFTPSSVPRPSLASMCRLPTTLPRKKATWGPPPVLPACMRDCPRVLRFAHARTNPCTPPNKPMKHETLNMKQMQYTFKTTKTFKRCTCNICMKHMKHVGKTLATYICSK